MALAEAYTAGAPKLLRCQLNVKYSKIYQYMTVPCGAI